ncbi:MAG: DUF4058 family protein [Planctomycetaceae bacterium]|nr:DUF4058 family protein [Planctomycetaceae bacterium]
MPSPFPGMDPFIEAQKWESFHFRYINQMGDILVELLRPRYEVNPEQRIYVETVPGRRRSIRADVAVSRRPDSIKVGPATAAVLDVEPSLFTLPMPEEERELFLTITRTGSSEVVTIVEVLSPGNKRLGSDGRREYIDKRGRVLRSHTHLVEVDLLLEGERLPVDEPLRPTTDYCVFVSRSDRRPVAEGFEWTLQQRLPRIPIPLAGDDPDAILDLQRALDVVYHSAGYDYALEYNEPLDIEVRPASRDWIEETLRTKRSA